MHPCDILLDDGRSMGLLIGATAAMIAILTLALICLIDAGGYVVTTLSR